MTDAPLTRIPPERSADAWAMLTRAFAQDPVERWLYPSDEQYAADFPPFLAAFGGRALDERTAWGTGDLSAVALWLAPGVEPDGDRIVEHLQQTVDPSRHEELFDILGQMDEAHPRFEHWYLPWLGVDPGAQGRGVGGRVLADCLTFVDEAGLPAYLETPNQRTVPFYERHGFEVTRTTSGPTCPPLTFMLRPPRG